MAKNKHSGLHQYIERSVIVQINFSAVTQISFVILLKLHLYFLVISIKYDAQFKLALDPKKL